MVRRKSHARVSDANLERRVYACICKHDGIKTRDIAGELGVSATVVNRCLYRAPLVHDLCYRDDDYRWYGVVQQRFPHVGLGEYCGWYGTVAEFLATPSDAWLAELERNCRRIGRNLNDMRGLYHSFNDTEQVMRDLFAYLNGFETLDCAQWEVAFEVRLKRGRFVRIYADVLVISPSHAFSLEFKMKNEPDFGELSQAVKYRPYLEVVLGDDCEVVPALVLTRAEEVFERRMAGIDDAARASDSEGASVSGSSAVGSSGDSLIVCSADMLMNVFDECLGFLQA